MASEKLPITHKLASAETHLEGSTHFIVFHLQSQRQILSKPRKERKKNVLDGSSIRPIVPDTHAALREITNSKPSLDARVTYSEGGAERWAMAVSSHVPRMGV